MPDKRKMRTGKKGQEKDRPHDDGAGEAQTKKARRRTRRAGEHGRRAAAVRSGQRKKGQAHPGMAAAGPFPEGSAVFLLAPGGKFFQTLFPGTRGRTMGHSAATAILEDPAHDEEHDDDADDGEQRSRHMTSRA